MKMAMLIERNTSMSLIIMKYCTFTHHNHCSLSNICRVGNILEMLNKFSYILERLHNVRPTKQNVKPLEEIGTYFDETQGNLQNEPYFGRRRMLTHFQYNHLECF